MSVRFAPSPTGVFHIGNFRTAWISHEFARKLKLPWIVRFEDIDKPRVIPGALERQLKEMNQLGLKPDQVVVQSGSHKRHEKLFRSAIETGQAYPCSCSRKEILLDLQSMASAPHGETPVYNGRCRKTEARPGITHPTLAWRFKNPSDELGRHDFIIGRTFPDGTDFVPSYQWACAIDDYDGEHTLLVRAWDLEHVIPQQRAVYQWVGDFESVPRGYPAVFHSSLVVAANGARLEKRTQGVTLPEALKSGLTEAKLIESFRAGFDPELLTRFVPGKIWGEAQRQIQLPISG